MRHCKHALDSRPRHPQASGMRRACLRMSRLTTCLPPISVRCAGKRSMISPVDGSADGSAGWTWMVRHSALAGTECVWVAQTHIYSRNLVVFICTDRVMATVSALRSESRVRASVYSALIYFILSCRAEVPSRRSIRRCILRLQLFSLRVRNFCKYTVNSKHTVVNSIYTVNTQLWL